MAFPYGFLIIIAGLKFHFKTSLPTLYHSCIWTEPALHSIPNCSYQWHAVLTWCITVSVDTSLFLSCLGSSPVSSIQIDSSSPNGLAWSPSNNTCVLWYSTTHVHQPYTVYTHNTPHPSKDTLTCCNLTLLSNYTAINLFYPATPTCIIVKCHCEHEFSFYFVHFYMAVFEAVIFRHVHVIELFIMWAWLLFIVREVLWHHENAGIKWVVSGSACSW